MVKRPLFATAQDAETAFYEAFAKGDLDAMMAVWADDDEIYCVHPRGPRLSGVAQVRESWRQIFASGQSLRFHLRGQHVFSAMMVAVHSVYEHITVVGEAQAPAPMIATNIFMRTDRGWRMVAHHASPAPAAGSEDSQRGKKTLH